MSIVKFGVALEECSTKSWGEGEHLYNRGEDHTGSWEESDGE